MFNIIVPVSKKHRYIYYVALDSILRQRVSDFRVIVVFDGFHPAEIESRFCNDNRFIFVNTKNETFNIGASQRNFGLRYIDDNRRYICYLDADNEWLCFHLETCLENIKDNGIITTSYYILDNFNQVLDVSGFGKELCKIDTNGFCINLDIVDKEDIYWTDEYGHDFSIFDRLSNKYKYEIIKKKTYLYNINKYNIERFITV